MLVAILKYIWKIKWDIIWLAFGFFLYRDVLWYGHYGVIRLPKMGIWYLFPNLKTYLEPVYIPAKFDFKKPPVRDLQFGNNTYLVPTRFPDPDSWSPEMIELIKYNRDNMDAENSKLFMYLVNEIDNTAEYASENIRYYASLYHDAHWRAKKRADMSSQAGMWRLDSKPAFNDGSNGTELHARMVWELKGRYLMAKYQHTAMDYEGRMLLKWVKMSLNFLGRNDQGISDGSRIMECINKFSQDIAMWDELLYRSLPGTNKLQLDKNLIKFKSQFETLHEQWINFRGVEQANAIWERFHEPPSDWGYVLPVMEDDHYKRFWKKFNEDFCPYDATESRKIMNNQDLDDLRKLSLQQKLSKELNTNCITADAQKKPVAMKDDTWMRLWVTWSNLFFMHKTTAWISDARDYYDKFNDDVHRLLFLFCYEARATQNHDGYWYSIKHAWVSEETVLWLELWFVVGVCTVFCGNHRGCNSKRVNKNSD